MLDVRNLTKSYGEIAALRGVSLQVHKGQLLGFLGPNGAGKTTTMRSVFGLVAPGRRRRALERQADRGAGPPRLWLHARGKRPLPAYAQSRTGCVLRDASRHESPVAYLEAGRWLEDFGLADRAHGRLEELSHGNQQRLQLAAALVHSPELLVLDEPFAGLDPVGVGAMGEILASQAASGTAVVFSSHQLDLVEDLCDDVVIINEGAVALAGAVRELRTNAAHRHVTVEVRDCDRTWFESVAHVELVRRDGDRVVLDVSDGIELDALLAAAQAAGEVVEFSYEPPSLNEVFLDAVGGS